MLRTTILGAAVFAALLFPMAQAEAASTPDAHDVTTNFLSAGVTVPNFQAIEVGGILILRGDAAATTDAGHAGEIARDLGYNRVANLIRVIETVDDDAIE